MANENDKKQGLDETVGARLKNFETLIPKVESVLDKADSIVEQIDRINEDASDKHKKSMQGLYMGMPKKMEADIAERQNILEKRKIRRNPPRVKLVIPKGKEIWKKGESNEITWEVTPTRMISKHRVEYSDDGGANWNIIVDWTNGNPLKVKWEIPDISSDKCLVRVSCKDDKDIDGEAISYTYFKIIP